MKKKEEIIDSLYKLTPTNISTIKQNSNSLISISDNGEISETNIKLLGSVIDELRLMYDTFLWRYINSLKRGDLRD